MRIEYTRPFPELNRSERNRSVCSPVMNQSGSVLPWPGPLTSSLLVTSMILHVASPHSSVTKALTFIGIIRWLGGQSVSGVAAAAVMTGGVRSTIMTDVEQLSLLPKASTTESATLFEPNGNSELKETVTSAG